MSRAGPPSAPAGWRASARSPQHAGRTALQVCRPPPVLARAGTGARGATSPCCPAYSRRARSRCARSALLHAFNMPPDPRPPPRAARACWRRLLPNSDAAGTRSHTPRCPLSVPPLPSPHRTPALPFRGLASSPLCLSPSPSTPVADPALTQASPIWSRTRAPARLSRAADGGPENDTLSSVSREI